MIPPKLRPGPPYKYDWTVLNKPSRTRFVEGSNRNSLLNAAKNYFRNAEAEFTTRRVGKKYRVYRTK